MRKVWIVSLASLVFLACILSAGCVSQNTPVTPAADPVQTITFEKTGTSYTIGESFLVTLPSNPTTGYDWYAKETDGLNITKAFIAPDSSLAGAPGQTVFTITSVKEGTYEYVFEYKRAWENDTAPLYVYKDVRTCVPTTDAALTAPRGTAVIEGSVNPAVGEVVKITTSGNPTTGYTWSAVEGSGLKVISAEYVAPTSSALGAGGQYVWLVTAEMPGSYIFKGVEQRSGDAQPLTTCSVGITFVDAGASPASGAAR